MRRMSSQRLFQKSAHKVNNAVALARPRDRYREYLEYVGRSMKRGS